MKFHQESYEKIKKDMNEMQQKSQKTIEFYKSSIYETPNYNRVTSKSQYRRSYDKLKTNNVFNPLFTPSKSFSIFENIKSIQGIDAKEPKKVKI